MKVADRNLVSSRNAGKVEFAILKMIEDELHDSFKQLSSKAVPAAITLEPVHDRGGKQLDG